MKVTKDIVLLKPLLVIILLFMSNNLLAQQSINIDSLKKQPPQPISNLIKFNPFPIFWGAIPLTSEYRLLREIPISTDQSIQVGFSYLGKNIFLAMAERQPNFGNPSWNNPQTRITTNGYRLQLSYRYFIGNKLTPKGAYIGPLISYSEAYFSDKYMSNYQVHVKVTHFNANMLIGYQVIIWNKIAMDLFTGLGYKKNLWQENTPTNRTYQPIDIGDIPFYSWPVKFTLGVNFGIAFE